MGAHALRRLLACPSCRLAAAARIVAGRCRERRPARSIIARSPGARCHVHRTAHADPLAAELGAMVRRTGSDRRLGAVFATLAAFATGLRSPLQRTP
jgi:hypothetical protein